MPIAPTHHSIGVWWWLSAMVLALALVSALVTTHPRLHRQAKLRDQVLSWWRLLPFMAASLIWWPPGPALLAALILALSLRELNQLARPDDAAPTGRFAPGAAIGALLVLPLCVLASRHEPGVALPVLAVLACVPIALAAWGAARPDRGLRPRTALWLGWLGLWPAMACLLAWPAADGLQGGGNAQAWVFYLLALTSLNDIAQFVSGTLWGRHALVPGLSPNKTWQGLAGGVAGSIALSLAIGTTLDLASVPTLCALGALLSVVGTGGDLYYSMIKRQLGIKDFSGLIPGHGGILDRVDSLTATAPTLAAWLALAPVPT